MNEQLLEPLKFYEKTGKRLHEENVTAYFEELYAKSGVDGEQNRRTVGLYNKEMAIVKKTSRSLSWKKTFRVLLIIAAVIGGILALYGGFGLSESKPNAAIYLIAGAATLILSLVLIFKVLNPRIRETEIVLKKHQDEADRLRNEGWAQMAPLNALFDNTDTHRLIEKTLPELDFEDRYTTQNEAFFIEAHDFLEMIDGDRSVINTLSGRFSGNPFLFCRCRVHEMGTKTYYGSLTITWTETYRDSKGNLRTRTRSQVLTASVVKPKPYYRLRTFLCYGSQAAPDLRFSRAPQHSEQLSEKQRNRKVEREGKKLRDLTEKALSEGRNFQEMANTEFEVLFGATDRDHEVQFRLMYTPLGQTNTVDLVTSKEGYGDDFHFFKRRRFNIIESEHAQSWEMDTSPRHYVSFDLEQARRNFISFNCEYFKSVFFDLAPLLSVPAYLEEPCASLEPPTDYPSNYTDYEHEVMANALGGNRFAHERTATEVILKTNRAGRTGEKDHVAVTAFSYAAENRVDIIPCLGGDGRMHGVPVPWVEYIPLEKTSPMTVAPAPISERELREHPYPQGTACYHGMVADVR